MLDISFSSGEANDTATKSVDYYLPVDVVFSPDSPRLKNISIKLVEDYLVEGKEHLTIMFSTTDEDVIYTSNKAKVTIEDSNSKLSINSCLFGKVVKIVDKQSKSKLNSLILMSDGIHAVDVIYYFAPSKQTCAWRRVYTSLTNCVHFLGRH